MLTNITSCVILNTGSDIDLSKGELLKQMSFNKELFKEIRKQRGLSIDELASAIGCSPYLVRNVENGTRGMSLETFRNAVTALGTSADLLLGLTNSDCVYENAYKRARQELSKKIKKAVEHAQ